MKYLIILIISSFISTNVCISQGITDKHQDVFSQVKEIDEKKDYQIVSLENEELLPEMTDGGAELLGYYEDGDLVKVSFKIFLSYGIRTFDYYFSNDDLLYINERFDQFYYNPETDVKDYLKTELTFSGHYIFKDSKLIDYETLGHNRFEDDDIDPEKVLLEEADYYKKLIEKNK